MWEKRSVLPQHTTFGSFELHHISQHCFFFMNIILLYNINQEESSQQIGREWRSLTLGLFDKSGEELSFLYNTNANYRFEDSLDDYFLTLSLADRAVLVTDTQTEAMRREQITHWVCGSLAPCDWRPPSPIMGYIGNNSFPLREDYDVKTLLTLFCLTYVCNDKSAIKTQFMIERVKRRHEAQRSLAACQASEVSPGDSHCLYSNTFVRTYAFNEHSQNGEDGILAELLLRLGVPEDRGGWVCEFGAWDGRYLSNTFSLVKKGFQGVFIEGNTSKFQDLLETVHQYPNIIPLNAFVHFSANHERGLDNLLQRTPIPFDFDVLSIDVDSYDYHIWDSLKQYAPKIVVIEMNSQIGTDVEHVYDISDLVRSELESAAGVVESRESGVVESDGFMEYELGGSGFRSTLELGRSKQYSFVLHVGSGNMIFVRNDLFPKLDIEYANVLENFDLFGI
jgi:hypothetical protein